MFTVLSIAGPRISRRENNNLCTFVDIDLCMSHFEVSSHVMVPVAFDMATHRKYLTNNQLLPLPLAFPSLPGCPGRYLSSLSLLLEI